MKGLRETLDRAIAEAPREDLVELAGELESARTRILLKLVTGEGRSYPKAAEEPDENLEVKEAARRLGVSVKWLYTHGASLPFTIRVGRKLLFSAQGLERWSKRQQGR